MLRLSCCSPQLALSSSIPSTSGTGGEVSPNAIILDESAQLKKGVISPHLVPDAAFIAPTLTHSVPPAVTAYTGLDALTHLIEAYTNRFAHPLVDIYALEGICTLRSAFSSAPSHNPIRRRSYATACRAQPLTAASASAPSTRQPCTRSPILSAASSTSHTASRMPFSSLLLFRFNAKASQPERHANVALALGAASESTALAIALAGAVQLEQLTHDSGIDTNLAHHGIDRSTIPYLAAAAMTVQRLLRNNPRDLTQADAESIYSQCFRS